MFGRQRPVPELTSKNGQIRSAAERVAVNMPIQGTAADILKRAMIDVDRRLAVEAPRTRMILTVHDELLFEAPREDADAAAALVREAMASAVTLGRAAGCGCGDWRELERSEALGAGIGDRGPGIRAANLTRASDASHCPEDRIRRSIPWRCTRVRCQPCSLVPVPWSLGLTSTSA